MGVSYTPILGIGKEFDDEEDVIDFLQKHDLLSEDADLEDGVSEVMYHHSSGVNVELLNYYSGCGYFVGFPFYVRNINGIQDTLEKAVNKWHEVFPDEDCSVVHTVRVS